MTTVAERTNPLPVNLPSRIGQATAVEQSRAVAEVQAAIVVAQQCPRNVQTAIAEMKLSCSQMALAERAFYRYSRGGQQVTGPTVHLARELARCWGNVQHGEAELRRDDDYGQSEMQSFAWDVQTNTRSVRTFIVPHRRAGKNAELLTDQRDIYENNANAAARRLRETIFAILPPWFVEEAKALCSKTLAGGGGKPLPQRISDAITAFGTLGIAEDQLEQKLDRPSVRWTEHDVAQLLVIYQSIQRGEVTKEDEFPPQRVTAAEVQAAAQPAPTAEDEREAVIDSVGADQKLSVKQRNMINAIAPRIGLKDRDLLHHYLSEATGRLINSVNDLTGREASTAIDLMQDIERREGGGA